MLHEKVPTPVILGWYFFKVLRSPPLELCPDVVLLVEKLVPKNVWLESPTRPSLTAKPGREVVGAANPTISKPAGRLDVTLHRIDSQIAALSYRFLLWHFSKQNLEGR